MKIKLQVERLYKNSKMASGRYYEEIVSALARYLADILVADARHVSLFWRGIIAPIRQKITDEKIGRAVIERRRTTARNILT